MSVEANAYIDVRERFGNNVVPILGLELMVGIYTASIDPALSPTKESRANARKGLVHAAMIKLRSSRDDITQAKLKILDLKKSPDEIIKKMGTVFDNAFKAAEVALRRNLKRRATSPFSIQPR